MVPVEAAKRRSPAQRRFVVRSGAVAAVGALESGARMVFDPKGGWAMDAETLRPATLQTLVCAARDLHSDLNRPDADFARAVKALDTAAKTDPALRTLLEDGVAELDRRARQRFSKPYIGVGGEGGRHAILRALGASPFLHRLKEKLSPALRTPAVPTPLLGAGERRAVPSTWPDVGPELGRMPRPRDESRAGV